MSALSEQPHLARRPANFRPLTPLDMLERTVAVMPHARAVIWREFAWDWAGFGGIVARMAAQR